MDERQMETLLNELDRARGLVGVMINALSGPNDMENDFPFAFEMLLDKLDAVDEIARQGLPDRAERPAAGGRTAGTGKEAGAGSLCPPVCVRG